jgi:Expansin C-terminal domain
LNVAFHVEEGSNSMYLAILVEYANGDGDLAQVEVLESTPGTTWTPLRQSWGAIWRLDSSHPLQGPFSVRITTLTSGKTLVAENVIPADYVPNTVYESAVQFSPSF